MVENIYILIENICVIVCLFALFEKKIRMDIATMCVVVTNLILMHLVNAGKLEPVVTLLSYAIIFVYSLIEFSGRIRKTIINNILYMMVISLLQLICSMLMILVARLINNPRILAIIINVLVLLLLLAFRKTIGKLSGLVCSSQALSIASMLACFGMLTMVLLRYKVTKYVSPDMYVMVIVFVVLIAVLMHKWYESRLEIKRQQMELEMSRVYSEAFQGLLTNVRRQQHDINNHLNAIYSQHYVSTNYEELVGSQKEYCKYIEDNFRFSELLRIRMPILGGFLYGKFQDAFDRGIIVDTDIKISKDILNIPVYELISVLGILIDNAVEKTEQLEIEEKRIEFAIRETERGVKISVKNVSEYLNKITLVKMFDEGVSNKGENRGLGLNNVRDKAEKYGFDIVVENEEREEENWIKFELVFNDEG